MLTVDPGLRGCGCAWWGRSAGGTPRWTLLRAAHVPAEKRASNDDGDDVMDGGAGAWMSMVSAVRRETARLHPIGSTRGDVVGVEAMRVYVSGRATPADLVSLAAIGGGIMASFPTAHPVAVLASAWKGQVPRDVMGRRVEGWLRTGAGLPAGVQALWEVVDVPSRRTWLCDAMHAVGIGLYLIRSRAV